ncbi:twin-arginine translocase TatA/TatE family subunit [Candidatus Latescibacterota bacterium]
MWPGHWEWILIVLVVLLVFGAKRIPEMAQGLGKGIREFRKAVHEVQDEVEGAKPPDSVGATPAPNQVARATSPSPEPAPEGESAPKETPQG